MMTMALSVSTAAQTDATSQDWRQLTARLEGAVLRGQSAELRSIRADLLRRVQTASPSVDLVQYAIAYVGWRMATLPDVPERERGDLLDDGVSRIQDVVKKDGKNVEAQALLGSLYGLQIARSPMMKGISLGPRATAALERAAREAPANPRVVLQQGVSAFNTPPMFGGGTDKAERLLRRSIELFGSESPTQGWPNWGRFDAHAWLGQTLASKGDRTGARAQYDKALAIAPESAWVRYVLIPALEKTKK
jgi:tetratricopeptide (TPR) repeat protein